MNLDTEFLVQLMIQTLPNLLAGIAVVLLCSACRPIACAITKWKTRKLPRGPDADRVCEELQGIIGEMKAMERTEVTLQILARPAALSREIAQRAAERSPHPQPNVAPSKPRDHGAKYYYYESIVEGPEDAAPTKAAATETPKQSKRRKGKRRKK
jgi:hypothetical protein